MSSIETSLGRLLCSSIRLQLRHPVKASMRLALRLNSFLVKPSSTSVTSELAKVLSLYNSFGLKDARRKCGADYSMRVKGDEGR